MLLTLWPLHENVSLSYTPMFLLEPETFRGYMFWKVIVFHEKVFDEVSRWSFSSSICPTSRNFSELHAIKRIITRIIGNSFIAEHTFLTPYTLVGIHFLKRNKAKLILVSFNFFS